VGIAQEERASSRLPAIIRAYKFENPTERFDGIVLDVLS